VRAPTDTRLKLEEGDVILDIDGRVPTSPAHALRILGSYQPGESLKINALRMKKRIVLDLQLPERPAD
jgi:S1-C subfamily serine protease